MSDGLTEAYRGMRKTSYLNKIEIEKDGLFDMYMQYTNELIQSIDKLKELKSFFCKSKDYKAKEKDIDTLIIKIYETEKLITKLDQNYQIAEKKPTREF